MNYSTADQLFNVTSCEWTNQPPMEPMEQSPCWEANNHSASHSTHCLSSI